MNDIMKNKLNQKGAGFCLANWTQSTLFLPNGVTRSCGLPFITKIKIDEIAQNDYNLYNPSFRKQMRKEMLEGGRPVNCNYCWDIENKTSCTSERIFKSSESWSEPYFDEICNSNWEDNYNPKYLEVGFSHICNFKCAYCTIDISSRWMDEVVQNGPFNVFIGYNNIPILTFRERYPLIEKNNNPYTQAFWRTWPDIYRTLNTFRITGGEPLLCEDTWAILDYIINEKNPNRDLNLSINTNLCVGQTLITKLINKLEIIINENRVNEVILYASIDTFGPQSEYIRFGLNETEFWNNINLVLTKLPKISIMIMATYTILSLTNYGGLINKVYELNNQFNNETRYWNRSVGLATQLLTYPKHLNVKILFDEQKELILDSYRNLPKIVQDSMLPSEIEKIKITYEWSKTDLINSEIRNERNLFVIFIDEYDIRFGINFLETFPEFTDFYNFCKEI